jgi:Reverse transcriptase (RNA-dependent DNA polymerase)
LSYAPVADFTVVRIVLSIAARKTPVVHSLDASNAFVRAPISETVCVRPPKVLAARFGSKIMKLNKALYELKQSPLSWHSHLERKFSGVNIIKTATPCLYSHKSTVIVVYVDDLIISGPTMAEVDTVKAFIKSMFSCTAAGELKEFLGVRFQRRDDEAFVLSQAQYLKNVLERFGMQDSKPCQTPANLKINPDPVDGLLDSSFPYREAVGSLLYLATHTRPDISHTVGVLGRALEAPTVSDVTAVKGLMGYLAGTLDYGLVIGGIGVTCLASYSDADWGGDSDRKSTSGSLHLIGNDPVHWSSKKQTCVALSTDEAEYMAASSCSQEVLWLRHILCGLGCVQTGPTEIYEDNADAIKWSTSDSRRAKHLDLKVCFVHVLVAKKQVVLKYVPTKNQLADLFTKSLDRIIFIRLRDKLGMSRGGVQE